MFESLVNLEGCKTLCAPTAAPTPFESLVNLEGCKTNNALKNSDVRLRVLLIQKGVKQRKPANKKSSVF